MTADPAFLSGCPILLPQGRVTGMGLLIAGGDIAAILPDSAAPAGAARHALPPEALLAPGYLDLQVNGGDGIMFNDDPTPATARRIAAAHRRLGTTGILPTLITSDRPTMHAALDASSAFSPADGLLGLHLEGPFISPDKPGVHRPDFIRTPDEDDLARIRAAASRPGRLLLTIAPECVPQDMQDGLAAHGVLLSAGHSACPAEALNSQRVTLATHLFNAMMPIAARAPGLAGAVLSTPAIRAGIIADGIHVHPPLLRMAFQLKGASGLFLVSDAMAPAGTQDRAFVLQGRTILRRDGMLTTEDGVLAGADLCMAEAVRNAVRFMGASPDEAITMATETPARALGIEDRHGRIVPGAQADLCLLTPELDVLATWVAGEYSSAP